MHQMGNSKGGFLVRLDFLYFGFSSLFDWLSASLFQSFGFSEFRLARLLLPGLDLGFLSFQFLALAYEVIRGRDHPRFSCGGIWGPDGWA